MEALKGFMDVEKLLTSVSLSFSDTTTKLINKLILVPTHDDIQYAEQSINNVLILKKFVQSIPLLNATLSLATSPLLRRIRDITRPDLQDSIMSSIANVINDDVTHESKPLNLRNQRTYAVKVALTCETGWRS